MNEQNYIDNAEREIDGILKRLEVEVGHTVEDIGLRSLNITKVCDSRPQHIRCVHIELRRLPGERWSV